MLLLLQDGETMRACVITHLFSLSACLIHFSPAAALGTSVSPYHEVMRMERRLRSSSEGAGGPRVHGNHRDVVGMEGCGLLKHRNNSSSSKMGSLVGAFVPCSLLNFLNLFLKFIL